MTLGIKSDPTIAETDIIGGVERSIKGNLVLRIGRLNEDGESWHQVAHVALDGNMERDLLSLIKHTKGD